jgi:hypothetical protein
MISHRHRSIFFHVGRTAGTSIETMFLDKLPDAQVADRELLFGYDKQLGIYLQHASWQTVRELVDSTIFDGYFKFSIVRNPFSRIASIYRYRNRYDLARFGSFKNFVKALPTLSREERQLRGSHVISQTHYTHSNGKQVVDYIGKFEDLFTSVEYLNKKLSSIAPLIRSFIPMSNSTDYNLFELFDEETTAIMQSTYRDDFDTYGYADGRPGSS